MLNQVPSATPSRPPGTGRPLVRRISASVRRSTPGERRRPAGDQRSPVKRVHQQRGSTEVEEARWSASVVTRTSGFRRGLVSVTKSVN